MEAVTEEQLVELEGLLAKRLDGVARDAKRLAVLSDYETAYADGMEFATVSVPLAALQAAVSTIRAQREALEAVRDWDALRDAFPQALVDKITAALSLTKEPSNGR